MLTFREYVKIKEAVEQFNPQTFDPKQIKPVQWQMPNIMEERGEVTRQAQSMGLDWRQLMQAIRQARIVPLDNNTWVNMKNTNSTDPNLTLQEVMSWTHRDVGRIFQAFQTGGTLPAPIVVINQNVPYCLAGNTRLSVAKVLRVKPKVLMVNLQTQPLS